MDMAGADKIFTKGQGMVRDVVLYYAKAISYLDNSPRAPGSNPTEETPASEEDEDDRDEQGDDKNEEKDGPDPFIESLLTLFDTQLPAQAVGGKLDFDTLSTICQWSPTQHHINWGCMHSALANGIWHTTYDCYQVWHNDVRENTEPLEQLFDESGNHTQHCHTMHIPFHSYLSQTQTNQDMFQVAITLAAGIHTSASLQTTYIGDEEVLSGGQHKEMACPPCAHTRVNTSNEPPAMSDPHSDPVNQTAG
ncbi:hypothetical protein PAXRUDRAFT_28061 [Paxillus rubicundulus Ve08.2h10]|uniref:Uncharacterized protein n=1 Tax=Paxillus rubicundulus Ve08.2h10 TaxID=930991 RepID=A0A0D0DA81_9AGAM|nr:hypothetical protein PAXRUDRAFT_28061 [Paxillus rubicundulus Ve08.2h10]